MNRIHFLFACLMMLFSCPVRAENAAIPRVLSDADIARYQQIANLQREGKWQAARRVINKLENKLLLGHVDYQRLMHPTKYRSRYAELRGWLKTNADHPNAWTIYRLAKKRQGRARGPRRPMDTRYPGVTGQSATAKPPLPQRSRSERGAVRRFKSRVRRYVRKGQPERAEKRYWAIHFRELLAPHEAAAALERIAASYYYNGNDTKARALATLGAELARDVETATDWTAGLANWRMGNFALAYDHFAILGNARRAGSWLSAAGHYWAARAAYQLQRPDDAAAHLLEASTRSETFYGLIAARQLGIRPALDWTPPTLTKNIMASLWAYPAVRRAIALAEIGRDDLADEELRLLWGREGVKVQDGVLAFAAHLRLPAIQLRIGRTGGSQKRPTAAVRYPIPDWQPADGFKLDRAFIFAMMRQESKFGNRARSHAGARGLLQVTPSTASVITRDRSLFRRNKNRLYEPEFNMALGQAYAEYLLKADYVEGNLFMLLAAYNGGPGSLLGWKREVEYQSDPLLFIESIGFYETRHHIERVMANLWLYRIRLGQETPSLDAVASGAWPGLANLDSAESRDIQRRRRERLEERRSLTLAQD